MALPLRRLRLLAPRLPPRPVLPRRCGVRWAAGTCEAGDAEAQQSQSSVDHKPATASQLRKHFVQSAVPMVGFGFMDNTVMLHAGNAIDLTLGVTFGLSTLAAAACGQICSDFAGVSFGGLIEAAAAKLGLPPAELTAEQRSSLAVKRVGLFGSAIGVVCGCSLGLLNLLFIDSHQAGELKMAAASLAAGFSVNISNTAMDGLTVITLEGPEAIDGVIAAVTTEIATFGCRIQDMHGHRGHRDEDREGVGLTFVFCVQKEGRPVEDDELELLGRGIMKACNHPEHVRNLSDANEELRRKNEELEKKLAYMDAALEKHLLTVTRSTQGAPVVPPEIANLGNGRSHGH